MRKNKRKSLNPPSSVQTPTNAKKMSSTNCFQGEDLNHLLHAISREIEIAEKSRGGLPEKIWIKQQFSVGVNDVTRVLERMPRGESGYAEERSIVCNGRQSSSIELQAIFLSADCNPKLLTKHIPILASSRKVPVVYIKDNRGGSFRLGELVKVKTAMVIGVKARGSRINEAIKNVLRDNGLEESKI